MSAIERREPIAKITASGTVQTLDARQAALWKGMRQALLLMVDAIEVYLNMERTSEIRRQAR